MRMDSISDISTAQGPAAEPAAGKRSLSRKFWTAERLAVLQNLWGQGETAAAIGERLGGLSRSAVLGKVFRLRLDHEAPQRKRERANGKRRCVGSVLAEGFGSPARRRRRRKWPQPPPMPQRQHKTLFELTNVTCRWPYGRPGSGQFHFCGAAGADLERGIPYCERHLKRAYPHGLPRLTGF